MTKHQVDILIAGAGYVGLATAVAIKKAATHLNIMVVDAAPKNVWKNDQRASAIAVAAENMLDALGAWDDIKPDAQPINKMIVTDSDVNDPIRPIFLNFDGAVEDGNGEGRPFAHMIPNKSMISALRSLADELDITIRQSSPVTGFEKSAASVNVTLKSGDIVTAKLLIAADGARSNIRSMAKIRTMSWQYGQSGIVTTVAHERPHNGQAEEHFLPSGPFAILPLKGNRSSLVWTETEENAEKLVNGDDLVFEMELERRFGHRLGTIKQEGGRRAFPLGLTLAREYVQDRVALVGDAAHGIHPIAGQGLNLGFKGAAALAQTIVEADRLGMDIGALDVLERYQLWRRFDTVQMGVTTDILNRMFSNDITPLRHLRDFGLGLVERMPKLKSYFIEQAAGLQGEEGPKLLKGQPI
ncbi:ubiquinone biosynthesis hydroxylase [Lentilitoribacter sp. Alg239-R112]|uniref:ubiquinone biosynthesis hydroxylase n=1 Tax=Lentilitoribacter sp. Alg239-R112 TaxID=2305987 RepID=UPI0013A703D5|nr:ubiquinone biosynthesis hydroxylase [Lentilitoribacter sp. Alg239-R112]